MQPFPTDMNQNADRAFLLEIRFYISSMLMIYVFMAFFLAAIQDPL